MKKRLLTLFLALALVVMPNVHVNAESVDVDKDGVDTKEMLEQSEYKEGELIVIFKDGMSNTSIKSVVKSEDAACKDIIDVSEDNKASLVKISDEDDMESAIERFKDNSKVEYVQPNYRYSFFEDEEDIYKDPRDQYHFTNIKAKEAWALIESNTYSATKVAVLDTGVDVYHEDLQDNLIDNTSYNATLGGKILSRDYDAGDHGTHVTGIIAATYHNGIGVAGVASGNNNDLVRVMVVGTSFDGEYLYTADIIEAINYAKDNGAKVMNMSFGGTGRDRAMEAAVRDAYEAGVVMVASAGNDATNEFSSPTDFKEVISVNASNKYDKPTYWSDYGTYKDITAPGNNILSTFPGDDYEYASGTSMASPVVAGVAALVLDANPSLTPAQVYNILCASTGANSFDEYLGYGIVDAKAAVEAAYAASDSVSVTDLSIKDTTAEVYENDNIYLETLVRPATSLKAVTWSSSDESVATVDSVTGKVTGVSVGTATITASVDGKEVSCEVTVKPSVSQTSLVISNKEDFENVIVGFEGQLNAKITPDDATNQEIYYKSSDRKVVDVDEVGYITAVSAGTVTITAKTYDGNYSDSVEITVHKDARTVSITKSATDNTMLVDDVFTYEAKALDVDGEDVTLNNNITWKSTNKKVATVNSITGEVTALAPGITYIVATANNPYRDTSINKTLKLIVAKKSYTATEIGLKVARVNYNTVALGWNEIIPTATYKVYRSTNKDFSNSKLVATKSGDDPYYRNTNLVLGTTYYYKVVVLYTDGTTVLGRSYIKNIKTYLTKPTLKINNNTKNTIKLSWNKITGATGYTVYRSTSLNGKYAVLKNVTVNNYSNVKLTSGKKYYYKIRAYRTENGKKVYSSYSNTVNKVVK